MGRSSSILCATKKELAECTTAEAQDIGTEEGVNSQPGTGGSLPKEGIAKGHQLKLPEFHLMRIITSLIWSLNGGPSLFSATNTAMRQTKA